MKGILRNLRVEGRPSGQKHKVYDLTREGAADLRFNNRRNNDESQSVEEYYERQHGITLRFPRLPCISASNRPNRPCWVPLELCSVVDAQRYLRQLTPQQVAAIGNLRLKPDKRRTDIANAVGAAGLANNPLLEAFGMRIQPNMMQADGRQLEPPVLQFGEKGTLQPRDGQWNMNDKRMFTPAKIGTWAVVCFDHRVRDPMQVATALKECCVRKGLVIESRPEVIVEDTRREAPEKLVERVIERLKQSKPAFVLWILEVRKTSPLYAPIKKLCDTVIGVPTQCIVQPPGKGFNDQYLTNVALKMNMKMRGVNWVLTDTIRRSMRPLNEMPTMVFGLDVSHGAPGSHAPSVAAVVASMDPNASKYAVRRRAQHRRQETILGLFDAESDTGGMLCELMNDFGNANKMGPKRIIVFRDGISESQFPTVGATELQAFRKAFELTGKKVGVPNFRPAITYIVAQKRNNVRFLPSQGDRNVQPGTIVDKDVTHPFFFDFYMVSHKGLLGTSRPVHYHVLHDENGFTADEIQHLTHSLCYSYGRCTRAVSTGTPSLSLHHPHNLYVSLLRHLKSSLETSQKQPFKTSQMGGHSATVALGSTPLTSPPSPLLAKAASPTCPLPHACTHALLPPLSLCPCGSLSFYPPSPPPFPPVAPVLPEVVVYSFLPLPLPPSLPVAPVFYAHLAATHCRNHLDHDHDHDATEFSSEATASCMLPFSHAPLPTVSPCPCIPLPLCPCPSPPSLPVAPVFYAHLAATHCRNHFDHGHDLDATDFSSESSAGRNRDPGVPRPPPPPMPELPALAQGMPTRMFYC
ncbi:unnamed protein product [Closterium sp. NIES-53]